MIEHARIVFLTLLFSTTAFAGGMEGGGGYGFTCFNDIAHAEQIIADEYRVADELIEHIVEIIPQDLYVAQRFATSTKSELFEPQGKDLKHILDEYLKHIAKQSMPLAKKMTTILYSLEQNNVLFQNKLPHPNDHGIFFSNDKGIAILEGLYCVRVPLAVQFLSTPPSIHFDKRLYEHAKMSLQEQAVLWLHELLYLYARTEKGHTRSVQTTIALSYLLQKEGHFTKAKIEEALRAIQIL